MWRVTAGCEDDNCPKIITNDEAGMVAVQGYISDVPMDGVPAGEGRVRMSLADLERLAREHLGL